MTIRDACEDILNEAAEATELVKRAQDEETLTDTRIQLQHAIRKFQAAIESCEGLIKAMS